MNAMRYGRGLVVALVSVGLGTGHAGAQTFSSGSTGADGALAPTCSPSPCTVTMPLPDSGVFHFTTVSIPAGLTLRFTRNADNTPVTMLATGDVTIAGTINVSGAPGAPGAGGGTLVLREGGAGGPGGYAGGSGTNGIVSSRGGKGLGPGGGDGGTGTFGPSGAGGGGFAGPGNNNTGAGGPAYGSPTLLPLIGGSGGGGAGTPFGWTSDSGGGGGGALLIAASGTITLTGRLESRGGGGGCSVGGGGGGSGGAIRLIATTITGSGGSIDVGGGGCISGSAGRVRVEAFTNTSFVNYSGIMPSFAQPSVATLPDAPGLRITSVAGAAAPLSPGGSYAAPDIILPSDTVNPVSVGVAATNIPVGTVVNVVSNPLVGPTAAGSGTLSGSAASSTATVSVTIPTNTPTVITASATFTIASLGGGPVYAEGEEIDRVRVSATAGGPTRVVYVTRTGREIALQ